MLDRGTYQEYGIQGLGGEYGPVTTRREYGINSGLTLPQRLHCVGQPLLLVFFSRSVGIHLLTVSSLSNVSVAWLPYTIA